MKDQGHPDSTRDDYQRELEHFIAFVQHGRLRWDQIFSFDVLILFQKEVGKSYGRALRALSWYLFIHQKIKRPIEKHFVPLPPVYEQYLAYRQKSGQVTERTVKQIRRVLVAFEHYLKKSDIDLGTLKIDQIDDFLAQFLVGFAPATCRLYRGCLKGFLRHLYQHKNGRNLAPLVVGKRLYAQQKPPKFLRPAEVKKLFAGLSLSSPCAIRTYATVHLAYLLGLRPVEIHRISLDDICFTKAELRIKRRKNDNPMVLPIPSAALKAISVYMIGARPKSRCRTLFLSHQSPHGPLCAGAVAYYMTAAIRQAGLTGTAYWLRHTYAQNLLESGATIFEIKQMLGHDKIESTKVYLHVHIKLMRKVLFDE
ncbi:MAG: tyrosine-type recombinase/integrase [Moraxella sp.]|nr:tyrosine-type recombinase/integrase [Moraxella sp.]